MSGKKKFKDHFEKRKKKLEIDGFGRMIMAFKVNTNQWASSSSPPFFPLPLAPFFGGIQLYLFKLKLKISPIPFRMNEVD